MTSNYPPNQYAADYQPTRSNKTNGLAIAALVSSFFISIVGIILGHIALNQIKRTGEGGRGLAIAGLVIGYLGLLAGIIVVIATLGLAATA